MQDRRPRVPRYSVPLPVNRGERFEIPKSWEELPPISPDLSDPRFLSVLERHGFRETEPIIPLQVRYTRGRRWTQEEFQACFDAWKAGISLTLISAALNRNPQDIIYRLLDRCSEAGLEFTEIGRSEGSNNWTSQVATCAMELFDSGLPAWKIAVLFRVDFEHVEKKLYTERPGYGHRKRNPFGVNTTHKHFVNEKIICEGTSRIESALDAFAGEGNTAKLISRRFPNAEILAVEADRTIYQQTQKQGWPKNVVWKNEDNLAVIEQCTQTSQTFDFIDIDPFVTCHEQLQRIWPLLRSRTLLFVTFGGEYRRSFIGSNRKAIARRYQFDNPGLSNKEYLEVVPYYFLGWVARLAATHSFVLSVFRAVRYANNCRFWLQAERVNRDSAKIWYADTVSEGADGARFRDLEIPRFSQVRAELDEKRQLEFSL